MMKKGRIFNALSPLMVGAFAICTMTTAVFANETSEKLIILSTSDVHCSVDANLGYTGLAAYRDHLVETYGEEYVILVDAGDAIQGGSLGILTKGQALVDLMNAVEYDYFIPGNHEYDYGMEQHFVLMNQMDAHILSANFEDLTTGEVVYDGFDVVDFGDVQVGFVGMTTPATLTSSAPTNFQDASGNLIYGFGGADNLFYSYVQTAIDGAIAEGADVVIGVGHMGDESDNAPWRSSYVIQNTSGLDIFIDGHSHVVMPEEIHQDIDGNDVILTQAGSHFENIGEIAIDLNTLEITVDFVPSDFALTSAKVDEVLTEINAGFEALLGEVVATCEVDLIPASSESADNITKIQENNLGNLIADAHKVILDSDIGIINEGGIRSTLEKGTITYGDILNIHPFGNDVSSIKISGQTLLDALEMGTSSLPDGDNGFLYVSGVSYSLNVDMESSVVTDDIDSFLRVDGPYRVHDVLVGGEPLDLEKMYTVAGIDYLLLAGGGGMSMFVGNEVVKSSLYLDCDMLIRYICDVLGGVIGEEYAYPNGTDRITATSFSEQAEVEEVVEVEEIVVEEVVEEIVVVEEVVVEAPKLPELEVVTPTGSHSYTVKSGDNLSHIARDFLGSANRWEEIYFLNQDSIKNPNMIYIGQVLQLPTTNDVLGSIS